MSVRIVRLLNDKHPALANTIYSGASCTGIFQAGHNASVWRKDGVWRVNSTWTKETQELCQAEGYTHCEVSFAYSVGGTASKWLEEAVKGKLFQALSPGLEIIQAGGDTLKVQFPVSDLPADQLVSALRLLKSFGEGIYDEDFAKVRKHAKDLPIDLQVPLVFFVGVDVPASDAYPVLSGTSLADYKACLKEMWESLEDDTKNIYLNRCSQGSMLDVDGIQIPHNFFLEKNHFFSINKGTVYFDQLLPLMKGQINKGIQPSFLESGYSKQVSMCMSYFHPARIKNAKGYWWNMCDTKGLPEDKILMTVNYPFISTDSQYMQGPALYEYRPLGSGGERYGEGPGRYSNTEKARRTVEFIERVKKLHAEGYFDEAEEPRESFRPVRDAQGRFAKAV